MMQQFLLQGIDFGEAPLFLLDYSQIDVFKKNLNSHENKTALGKSYY